MFNEIDVEKAKQLGLVERLEKRYGKDMNIDDLGIMESVGMLLDELDKADRLIKQLNEDKLIARKEDKFKDITNIKGNLVYHSNKTELDKVEVKPIKCYVHNAIRINQITGDPLNPEYKCTLCGEKWSTPIYR